MKLLGNMFGSNTHMPTALNNPFAIDKVEDIWIHMRKKLFSEGFSFTGSVEFSNGRTKGEQKFEGADIMDVVKQIYAFLEQLSDLKCKLEVIRELMVVFGYSASLGDVEQALYNDLCHLIDEEY